MGRGLIERRSSAEQGTSSPSFPETQEGPPAWAALPEVRTFVRQWNSFPSPLRVALTDGTEDDTVSCAVEVPTELGWN